MTPQFIIYLWIIGSCIGLAVSVIGARETWAVVSWARQNGNGRDSLLVRLACSNVRRELVRLIIHSIMVAAGLAALSSSSQARGLIVWGLLLINLLLAGSSLMEWLDRQRLKQAIWREQGEGAG